MNRFVFGFCLTGVATAVLADTPAPPERTEVLVTASRVEEPIEETLWSSTVLTRADIAARQASSVQELLADVAGISIVNNGGSGKVSTILLRGAESDHTLLLIDGVRVASATAGIAPFELIPLEQIERIEVVRGPRSTLYGTDAIGGVIQIFTRHKPAATGVAFGGSLSGGSHDTQKIAADLQARGERAWLNVGAESFDTNGFNSCSPEALAAFAACFANEPDLDGYRSHSGSLALGYQFSDGWTAELRSLAAEGKSEFDGSFQNAVDFSERVVSLRLSGKLSEAWHAQLVLGQNADDQDNFIDDIPAGNFDTTRDTATVQLDGRLSPALRLISGLDYQRDRIASDTAFVLTSRTSAGAFSELHGEFAGWSTLAGARYEDNEQFGGQVTGNAGAAHKIGDRQRLSVAWGTAFHAPSFNDLYFPFFGNPELDPEESQSVEVGIDGVAPLAAPLRWSLHAFQTDIDRLIAFDPVAFIPVNVAKSRIRGAELQAQWRSGGWQVGGHVTRLDPVNRSDGRLLPRRAKESASLELRHSSPSFSIGTVARYEGERFDDLANNRRLGGFFSLDLAAEQAIGRALKIQARVANLFDRDYSTAAFYLQDGRNYSLTLRYRFAQYL
jgi:vitamin B12 transporter